MKKDKENLFSLGVTNILLNSGVSSLLVKIVNTLLGLFIGVYLARNLGSSGYGVYSYVLAVITLISIPAQLGLGSVVVRETVKADLNKNWGLMSGLWLWSGCTSFYMSIMLISVSILMIFILGDSLSSVKFDTLVVGFFVVPFIALSAIRSAALRGLRYVVWGQVPESLVKPVVFILIVLFLNVFTDVTPLIAMLVNFASVVAAFFMGAIILWCFSPIRKAGEVERTYNKKYWISAAIPLALVSGVNLFSQQIDILLIEYFMMSEDVGVYRVAISLSALVSFGLSPITMVLSPHFSRLYEQGDFKNLQKIVSQGLWFVLLIAVPSVILIITFSENIILYIYGEEYSGGNIALIVLAVGALISTVFGPVGALLNMTGNEKETARGAVFSAVSNVILNFLFIPVWGIEGAAFATSLSMIIYALYLWRKIKLLLGINTVALSGS